MANAKTLAHFDSKLKTSVVVDASPFALGAVLVQRDRVVAYGHHGLTDIERIDIVKQRGSLSVGL